MELTSELGENASIHRFPPVLTMVQGIFDIFREK